MKHLEAYMERCAKRGMSPAEIDSSVDWLRAADAALANAGSRLDAPDTTLWEHVLGPQLRERGSAAVLALARLCT